MISGLGSETIFIDDRIGVRAYSNTRREGRRRMSLLIIFVFLKHLGDSVISQYSLGVCVKIFSRLFD